MSSRHTVALIGAVAVTIGLTASSTHATSVGLSEPSASGISNDPAETAAPWDFNGDGAPDLAVRASRANVSGEHWAGAVGVFYGTDAGPGTEQWQRLERSRSWIPGEPGEFQQFGEGMASGDFDGDGHADLALCGGGLTIAFGGPDGLTEAIAIDGPACTDLAAADIDSSGHDDLIVADYEVEYAFGGDDARSPAHWEFELLDPGGEEGTYNLATGDVNGDGFVDVAFAVDYPVTFGASGRLWMGGPEGFTPGGEWTYGEDHDLSPLDVAIGDLNGDGFDDLVSGFAAMTVDDVTAGGVDVWYGTADGVDVDADPERITQSTSGVPGTSERGDQFGYAVAVDDLSGDGHADLVVGVPEEDMGRVENAGRVVVVPGADGGPDTSATYQLHRNRDGLPGAVTANDNFGEYVDVRDLAGETGAELVVAAPGAAAERGTMYVIGDTVADVAWWFVPQDAHIDPVETRFGL